MHAPDTPELADLDVLRELVDADAVRWQLHAPAAAAATTVAAPASVRRCPYCEKRLARLNRGPCCYACRAAGREDERASGQRRRLPHEEILARYERGEAQAEIARALGLGHSSVKFVVQAARFRAAGIEPARGRARLLLPHDEILARHRQGEPAAQIARALRIPYPAVTAFLRQARQAGTSSERPAAAA